jgi:hypothetical protein
VTLVNPLAAPRAGETIVLRIAELGQLAPGLDAKQMLVVDGGGKALPNQLVDLDGDGSPDEILFQADFAPNETKAVKLRTGQRPLVASGDYRVYGRFVRERHDDFAWENDLVAHRVYGPDLETAKKEPLTSSGIDVWVKRVKKLVVDEWYMTDNYHQDNGEGADFYSVGPSRGCGGLGVWTGGKLAVSKNFAASRVLANGPIRLIFELTYAPWQAGNARVSETKRVVLDAGSQFNHFQSTFDGRGPLAVAIGIAKHPGQTVDFDANAGSMRSWEPLQKGESGNLGCAIVLPPGKQAERQQIESDHLLVATAPKSGPLSYYVGTAWDRAGRVRDQSAFKQEVESLTRRLATPVKVSLAALPSR